MTSQEHFNIFKLFIENGTSFAVIRPNDGEYLVMTEHDFSNIDGWHYNGNGLLSKDLRDCINKMKELNNTYI